MRSPPPLLLRSLLFRSGEAKPKEPLRRICLDVVRLMGVWSQKVGLQLHIGNAELCRNTLRHCRHAERIRDTYVLLESQLSHDVVLERRRLWRCFSITDLANIPRARPVQ